jgi:rRNA maturation RNase YbeY
VRREIFIFNGGDWLNSHDQEVISRFATLDSSRFKILNGKLSVAFLDEKNMKDLHMKFSNDDTLTDVITFQSDSGIDFVGEICVSPNCALSNCKTFGTTFSEELTLHLVHRHLHIFGLDDNSKDKVPRCGRVKILHVYTWGN